MLSIRPSYLTSPDFRHGSAGLKRQHKSCVLIFIRSLRSRHSDTGLKTTSFQLAHLLIRHSQAESFTSTVAHFQCHFRPTPQDKLLPYNPVLDDQEILRSVARLKYAPLPEATRPLIFLGTKNHIALQQRYLIVGVRSALRSVSHRCFGCPRFRAEKIQPFMAPLPPFRFPHQIQFSFSLKQVST